MLVIDVYMGIAVLLALGCVTAEILLIALLSKRYFEGGRPLSILLLIIAIIFILIGDGFGLIGMFIPNGQLEVFQFFAISSFVGTILSALFFLYFYEVFDSDSLFGFRQLLVTVLVTLTLGSFFLNGQEFMHNDGMDVYMMAVDSTTDTLNFLIPVVTGIVILLTIGKNYSSAWDKQKKQLAIIGVGAFIAYLTPNLLVQPLRPLLVTELGIGGGLFMVLTRIWVAIGFIIYWWSFGDAKLIGFLQKQHAQKFVVISEGGLPLYTFNFRSDETVKDELLFSGAITAIGSLFKESLGNTSVKDITLDDNRKLLFKDAGENLYSLILITPKSSKYLQESMKRFGDKLKSLLPKSDLTEVDSIEQKLTPVLLDSFGLPGH